MAQPGDIEVPQSVVDAVEAFVNTAELPAKRALVEAHPEDLLGRYADVLFVLLIGQYGDDPEVRGALEADQALLQDCRVRGVAEAFSNRQHRDREQAALAALGPPEDTPPVSGSREVDDVVNELLFADDHLSTERRLALARRGLSMVEADSSLATLFHITAGNTLLETYGVDRAGAVDEALGHFRTALDWARERDNVAAAATANSHLADAYLARVHGRRADNVREASTHARAAAAGFDPVQQPRDAARAEGLLANALEQAGDDLTEAHRRATTALDLLEAAPHPYTAVGIYQTLARIADRGGPDDFHDGGLTYLRRSVALVDRAADPDSWARAAMEFARVALHQDSATSEAVEEALSTLADVLTLTDHDRRPEQWAQVHQLLADAYRWRAAGDPADNYAQAIEHAEEALTVFSADTFPDQWATTTGDLADAHRLSLNGNPVVAADTSLELYTTLARFYRARDERHQWAATEAKIGATLLSNKFGAVERLAAAEEHYERARAEFGRLGGGHWSVVARVGLLGVGQQQIQAGAVAVTAELVATLLGHLQYAVDNSDRGRYPDEFVQVRLAGISLRLTLAEHDDRAQHVAGAAALLDEVRAAVTPRTAGDVFQARVSVAETAVGRVSDFEAIIDDGERLLAGTTTEASQQLILPALSRAYACLAFARLERGRTAEALALVEQGRARVLLDVLDGSADRDAPPRVARARGQIAQLRNTLNTPPGPGRPSDAQLGRALGVARRELATALAGAGGAERPGRPAADAVLVVPLVCAYGVALFVLPPGIEVPEPEHVVRLDIDRRAVQDAEVRWLTAAAQVELGRLPLDGLTAVMDDITGWLWTAIVGPIEQRLAQLAVPPPTALRVVFSPLSRLFPLHAAWRDQDGRRRELIEDRPISYAPSSQLLRQAEQRRTDPARAGRRALLLADSTGDLPSALDEVHAIAALTADAEVLAGAEATRAALLDGTGGCALVHVACHAAVNWFQPHYSVVQLADGYAYAAELAGLDLAAARLVVLSACQSAVTQPDPAAGEFTGLAAALLRAGTPAVIATLWSVNDQASSLLMRRFYEALLRDGRSPDAALRHAQRWLRNVTVEELSRQEANPRLARRWRLLADTPAETPYASPYFWAGYVLIGA